MACIKLNRLAYHMFNTRKVHSTANRMSSNWRDLMKKELENGNCGKQEQTHHPVCIYRIPSNSRRVEPKAYRPNNISIGPCHHGASHLRNMEALKKSFYRRLFNNANAAKLDEAFKFLEEQETNVRGCYNEDIKFNSDEFLQMMLVDGSFIVQLLRDLSACKFGKVPSLSPWMLPIIRREMIMLENQLPMFVLNKLFELIGSAPSGPNIGLKDLALRFFYPLLQVDSENMLESKKTDDLTGLHFLDLLRSAISPNLEGEEQIEFQPMISSVTELKEAGVRIKADKSKQLLDISFGKKWGFLRQLTIPSLYINDHRGTVFRNIVAFENCHKDCKPDVTSYLFFFNGLINSAGDVSLLHYHGVLHHSLGSDKTVSELINNITKEIVLENTKSYKSYLSEVLKEANSYFVSFYARKRASLVHHYLTSWVVGVSTIGAFFALYFTLIQTVCSFAESFKAFENQSFRCVFADAFCKPFRRFRPKDSESENSKTEDAATN